MGFEPAISVFERAKTFRALDRANTVIGKFILILIYVARFRNEKA
jgi:hypothetical protein